MLNIVVCQMLQVIPAIYPNPIINRASETISLKFVLAIFVLYDSHSLFISRRCLNDTPQPMLTDYSVSPHICDSLNIFTLNKSMFKFFLPDNQHFMNLASHQIGHLSR